MQGIFIKNIELEMLEIQRDTAIHVVASRAYGIYPSIYGELPTACVQPIEKTVYERMDVIEYKRGQEVRKHYFVKTDDRKLFIDLCRVTDGFIEQKIHEKTKSIEEEYRKKHQESFRQGYAQAEKNIKSSSWWRRLFNQF